MSILEDHASLKQVEAALDAGDEELEQDLERHLAAALNAFFRRALSAFEKVLK